MHSPDAKPLEPFAPLFDIGSFGDGWAAIDVKTGRNLGAIRSYADAKRDATRLNTAAQRGRKALARALGAVEDSEL